MNIYSAMISEEKILNKLYLALPRLKSTFFSMMVCAKPENFAGYLIFLFNRQTKFRWQD